MKPITLEEQEAARRIRNAENAARAVFPPHDNAGPHARLKAIVEAMTPEEFSASLVRAGTHNPDGSLTESYRDDGDSPSTDRCAVCGGVRHPSAFDPCCCPFGGASLARLDADGTAKPLTRIVSHAREGDVVGPGRPLVDPEHEDESGKRTPLVDPFIDHGNGAVSFSLPVAIANERELVAREAARADVALSTWIAQALRAHGPFADPKSEAERLVAIGETSDVDAAHIKLLEEQLAEEKARADAAEAKYAKLEGRREALDAIGREWRLRFARRARRWETFARRLWAARLVPLVEGPDFVPVCDNCEERRSTPHTWEACARGAVEERDRIDNEFCSYAMQVHSGPEASAGRVVCAVKRFVDGDPEHDCGACGAHLGRATWCPCWHGSNQGKPGAGTLVKRSKGENR